MSDARWMQEAFELAQQGEGLTRPNPPVGAVVVKGGRAIGRGYHAKAGGPHAEVLALRDAGSAAKGAALYVTLEPCSTHGRTPPCVEAILTAGIKRVVVGVRDPNPAHQGRGLRLLRRHGVTTILTAVNVNVTQLMEPFAKWVTTGRPFLTLKLGMTLDGRIADRTGASKWITSAPARELVQALRRRADAVLVGAETVRKDNPSLRPRPGGGRKPYRVIAVGQQGLPRGLKVLTDSAASRTLLAATKSVKLPVSDAERLGVAGDRRGGVSMPRLMDALGKRGILHVLCEGGGAVAESLVREGLVDEYVLIYAPSFLGGTAAPALNGPGWLMAEKPTLKIHSVEQRGPDIVVRAR